MEGYFAFYLCALVIVRLLIQYESAFASQRLQNYQIPAKHKQVRNLNVFYLQTMLQTESSWSCIGLTKDTEMNSLLCIA